MKSATLMPVPLRQTQRHRLALAIVFIGIGIRLIHFISERSLYVDEARLAINIGTRSFAGLTRPLDMEQVASVPFLWGLKGVTLLLGMSEVALRLIPFLAGCFLLVLVWLIAKRLMQDRAALGALLFCALSPALVRASNDAKPYSLDALCATLIALAALRASERSQDIGRLTWLGGVAIGASLISLPAAFVSLSALLLIGVQHWRRGSQRSMLLCLASATGVILAASVPYMLLYSDVATSSYMREYWQFAYIGRAPYATLQASVAIPADLLLGLLLGSVPPVLAEQMSIPVRAALAAACGGIVLVGAGRIARRNGAVIAGFLALPILATVMASALGLYPLRLRLVLFLAPFAYMMLASVLQGSAGASSGSGGRLGLVGLGVLSLPMALVSSVPALWPYDWQELREVVEQGLYEGDGRTVYVNAGAAPAWAFYTTDWRAPAAQRISWYIANCQAGGPAFENAPNWPSTPGELARLTRCEGETCELIGRSTGLRWRPYEYTTDDQLTPEWLDSEAERVMDVSDSLVWLVFAHYRRAENGLLDVLESRGATQVRGIHSRGAYAFQYRLPTRAVAPSQ